MNTSASGRKQCFSYDGRLGVILANSELQYGKEGLGLEPSQMDLIVYHKQPFSEPTVEDWPDVIYLFMWVLVLE